MISIFFFFFSSRRRHTIYWRDWSSDVCSSDLALTDTEGAAATAEEALEDVQSAIEDALTLDLKEQNNSGMSGTVALTPTSEGDVEVEIELEGARGDRIRRTSTPGRARTSIRSRNGRSRTS